MARGCDPESELLLKASQGERFHDRTRKAQLISLGKMNNDVINDVVTYALPPRNMECGQSHSLVEDMFVNVPDWIGQVRGLDRSGSRTERCRGNEPSFSGPFTCSSEDAWWLP